jgi:hypothetical protein
MHAQCSGQCVKRVSALNAQSLWSTSPRFSRYDANRLRHHCDPSTGVDNISIFYVKLVDLPVEAVDFSILHPRVANILTMIPVALACCTLNIQCARQTDTMLGHSPFHLCSQSSLSRSVIAVYCSPTSSIQTRSAAYVAKADGQYAHYSINTLTPYALTSTMRKPLT